MPRQVFASLLFTFQIIWLLALMPMSGQSAAQREADRDQVQAKVQSLYAEGERQFSKGDYAGATQNFQKALALDPQSPELLSNLGVAYHMEGHIPQAIAALKSALRLNPRLVPANLILGIDLVKLNQPQQALKPLEIVLAQQPGNRNAIMALASALFAANRFEEAAHVYLKAVTLRPSDADAWYGLGLCFEHFSENVAREMARTGAHSPYYYRLVGEFLLDQQAEIDAEQAFRQALAVAGPSDRTGLHAALGFALLGQSQFNGAQQEFRTELRHSPGNLEAELGLAVVELDNRDEPQAFRKLCTVYRADAGFYFTHLTFLVGALDSSVVSEVLHSKPANATPSCATAIDLVRKEIANPGSGTKEMSAFDGISSLDRVDPSRKAGSLQQVESALRSGDYEACAKVLAGIPNRDGREDVLLARCAFFSGRFYISFQAAQQASKAEPQSFAAAYWAAEASKELAQAAFDRAVVLNPNSWQAHILLGDIYRQRKQWESARSNYEQAARLKPSSPAPYLGLATIDWQNGEFAGAQENLEKVLALDGRNVQANFELGDILVRQHRFRIALLYLQRTVTAEPGLLAAHADVGKCYAALGQTAVAVAELTRALPTDRFGNLHYLLYVQYKKQGRTALARVALSESQQLRAREIESQKSHLQQAFREAKRHSGDP